jgi:SAM-dependent methyltransferase
VLFVASVDKRAYDEIERIRAVYHQRDSAPAPPSAWANRAYRLRMQELEWGLLDELSLAGLELTGAGVAEVGCGTGYFLSRFLDYGAAHAAGIDLIDERIAIARQRDPRLELVAGDAGDLPWPDACFDLVTQFTCLSSVLDFGLRRRIAAEMWRVTRPGGSIISYDMRVAPTFLRALRRAATLRRRIPREPQRTATSPVDLPELQRLFPNARLRGRSITIATDLPSLGNGGVLSRAIQSVPFLHTHLLILARKEP